MYCKPFLFSQLSFPANEDVMLMQSVLATVTINTDANATPAITETDSGANVKKIN